MEVIFTCYDYRFFFLFRLVQWLSCCLAVL